MCKYSLAATQFLILGLLTACSTGKPAEANCIDKEKIKTDAACIDLYDPVCGCNNVTYSNSCYADIAGVTKYTKGECP